MALTPYQFWIEANTLSRSVEGLIIALGLIISGWLIASAIRQWRI